MIHPFKVCSARRNTARILKRQNLIETLIFVKLSWIYIEKVGIRDIYHQVEWLEQHIYNRFCLFICYKIVSLHPNDPFYN